MEHKQVVQSHSSFGIGIEREIYSKPYFSYHYGYRCLSHMSASNKRSKIYHLEKILKEKFKDFNFQIIFLNVSSRGNFINFVLKDKINFESLGIVPVRDTNSFTIRLDDICGNDIPHREIFPKANLDEFNIESNTLNIVKNIISKFCPIFYCIGLNALNKNLNYNDIHLELYPKQNIMGLKDFINTLKIYNIDTDPFEKYFLNFKKFSHIKFRVKNGEIKNIKYYRSINVNIPEFYYE